MVNRFTFTMIIVSLTMNSPAIAADIPIESPTELSAAISNAAPGDRFVLAPGDYGNLTIKGRSFSPAITIEAADASRRPRFTSMRLSDLTGVKFENIFVAYGATSAPRTSFAINMTRGHEIGFSNIEIEGAPDGDPNNDVTGINLRSSTQITIENSEFHDFFRGITSFDSDDVVITNSVFRNIASDGIVGRGVKGMLIENNLFTEFHLSTVGTIHPDAIQFWDSGAPRENRDITIRGNVVLRGNGEPSQGFFIKSDQLASKEILIEHNVIQQSLLQGIYLQLADGAIVRNNTIVPFDHANDLPGIEMRGTIANVEIRDNMMASLRVTGTETLSGDALLQYDNPWQERYAGDFLAAPFETTQTTPGDLRARSDIGAHAFISEIGGFDAPSPVIAHQMIDNDPQSIAFALVDVDETTSADWSFIAPSGEMEGADAPSASLNKEFDMAGLWQVLASVRTPSIFGLDEIVAARKHVRVFPRVILDLTFPGNVTQNEAEPVHLIGAPVEYTDSSAAVFNGQPAGQGGQFLKSERAAAFSGFPKIEMNFRLRRPAPSSSWERLASLPGAFDVRLNGDRIRFLITNADGRSTVLDVRNAGISDGLWHDVVMRYDGDAALLTMEIDGVPVGSRAASGGLIAYKNLQTFYLGGAPWNNTFSGELSSVTISR